MIGKWMLEYGGEGEERERNALKQIAEEIKELSSAQPETPWIPVAERLPKQGRPVLFCDVDGDVFHGYYTDTPTKPSRWTEFLANYPVANVVAWMPRPKPYKGGLRVMNDPNCSDVCLYGWGSDECSKCSQNPNLHRCDTCKHEKEPWFNRCADCFDYELWEGKTE